MPRDDMEARIRRDVETWPELDYEVESIVIRIEKTEALLRKSARASLHQVGLTPEEFRVLIALHQESRTHGWLARERGSSTGAMTNRLDKMEGAGLVARKRDPSDRRGVLIELTAEGRQRLDAYISVGAARERQLLGALGRTEQRQLNSLLTTLLTGLEAELGPPPRD